MAISELTITQLAPPALPDALGDLTDILHACVHSGASIGFVLPFYKQDAAKFWGDQIAPSVRTGANVLFVARLAGQIVGTVQLGLDLPPNQPHRANVSKLLVHPQRRRLGIARALMVTLNDHAVALGKTLLVLDTRSSDPSQHLYESIGFQAAGEIPGFCRHPLRDVLESTTYLYKHLT
jgi:ribosomal protein S18 acetylase RimI-like enzyme